MQQKYEYKPARNNLSKGRMAKRARAVVASVFVFAICAMQEMNLSALAKRMVLQSECGLA
jgi:hypothetical protein